MKMLMLPLILILNTFAFADMDPNCRKKLVDEYAKEIADLSQEEIIERLRDIEERRQGEEDIDYEAEELVALLIKIGKSSELPITDCKALQGVDADEEQQKIIEELQEFCEESPQSFFAQIQPSGEIKFILKRNKASTKIFTISLSGELKLEYKGHTLTLAGSFNRNQTGDEGEDNYSQDTTQKYSVDYAINTGIENLDAFIKLKQEMEEQKTAAGDKTMGKTTIDLGIRPVIVDLDNVRLDVGLGIGGSRRYIGGSLNPDGAAVYRPIVTANTEFSYKPIDWAKTYIKLRVEQELSREMHVAASATFGAEFRVYRGLAVSGEYMASYDTARREAGTPALATTLMGNLSFSLDPRTWRGEDAQKAKEARLAREQEVWRRAQKRIDEMD